MRAMQRRGAYELIKLCWPGDGFDTMLKICKLNRKHCPKRKDQLVRKQTLSHHHEFMEQQISMLPVVRAVIGSRYGV
jgi:hypothetical protein